MRLFPASTAGRPIVVLATAGLVAAVVAGSLIGSPPSATASVLASPGLSSAAINTVSITGHGWGHGRGMGQYGAYGYALQGWGWQQILSSYYGGTALGAWAPGQQVTVELDEFDGSAAVAPGPTDSAGATTTVVSEYGVTRYYLGALSVVGAHLDDTLPLDEYVAGVVPAESPASWGVAGMAALDAQAVAARSYALAVITGSPSGRICDTTACQVYDGDPDMAGSPTNSPYTTYSDQAVQQTAGVVLLCQSGGCGTPGSVALAEFSSSTGGWTAPGAFPAVVDNGDATPGNGNPNSTWTQTVSATAIDAAYPTIGALTSVVVTSRNGLGDMGGRVRTMTVTGTDGSVAVTGDQFAAALGLRSDWFSPTGATGASGGDDGYWIVGADGSVNDFGAAPSYGSMVGQRLNGPIVAMAPSADQAGYWLVGSDGGIFSFGDARFDGSMGSTRLNKPILGMSASPGGGGYWLVASDGGIFSFGNAVFHGSTGSMRLNRPVVAMASTPDGGGYWLVASDGGIFAFGDAGFYGSTGSLALNQPIVGMVPTRDGGGYTLVGRDGGVFAFGDAAFEGSLPGLGIAATVSGVTATADGGGYLVVTTGGTVYPFGDAPSFGGMNTVAPGWAGVALGIFAHRGT